jgi:hypothetical protein
MPASLQRHTVVCAVFQEDTTIDLSFVQVAFLVPTVDHVCGSSRLLQDTNLELTTSRQRSSGRTRDQFKRSVTSRVVGGNLILRVVELDSKVLPLRLVHSSSVHLLVVLVKELELVLVGAALADKGASLKLDLVGRVVCFLVPDVLYSG